MSMTQAEAQTHLDAWLAADTALASGKSYSIGDRQLTRVNAQEVRDQIAYWQAQVNRLSVAANKRKPAMVATWP